MVTAAELPGWLRRLYPFEPRTFACGPVGLSYVDEGPRGDEAVVLLHGNPTWSFAFRDLIRGLAAAGHRCVAPDHAGMGLSDKPRVYPYGLRAHADNLAGLVEHLGLRRVHLVVHDWGGAIGFAWAVRQPERVGRIVLLNTAAFPAHRIPVRINLCRAPVLGEWLIRGLNGFARAATVQTVHRRPLGGDVKRGYLFPYDSWANRIGVARFVADIPMRRTHPSRALLEETGQGLARFRDHRVLIAWGGRDFCFTRWFYDRWLGIFPQAAAHHLADAGHYVLEDAGEEVRPLIAEFLKAKG